MTAELVRRKVGAGAALPQCLHDHHAYDEPVDNVERVVESCQRGKIGPQHVGFKETTAADRRFFGSGSPRTVSGLSTNVTTT